MRAYNAATVGVEPVHGDLRIGADGQLWKWYPERGQVTVASGGPEALAYAERHRFPLEVVDLIRAAGIASIPGRRP